MDQRKCLLLKKKLLLLKRKKGAERKRQFWVHPINASRDQLGLFNTLIPELRLANASDRHFQYFRMNTTSFDHLLNLIKQYITKMDTHLREAIHPDLKLAITLHHLAEGTSHSAISSHYRVGRSTVSEIIYDTCDAIYKVLQPIYLPSPSGPAEWRAIAEG